VAADSIIEECNILGNIDIGIGVLEVHPFNDFLIRFNNIYDNGIYSVAINPNCSATTIDATNNWWGTNDIELIQEDIYDVHDNPQLNTEVLIRPILVGPVGVDGPNILTTELLPPWPNPFNPQTNISFELSQSSHVWLSIYDLLGRQVAILFDGYRHAGPGSVTWNGCISRTGPSDPNSVAVTKSVDTASSEMLQSGP
jgi:hypothetical protein